MRIKENSPLACNTGVLSGPTGDIAMSAVDPDFRIGLVEELLDVIIKHSEDRAVAVVYGSETIDALLKVTGFLLAFSTGLQTRRDRRELLDQVTTYLGRQIVTAQDLKARGHFSFVTAIRGADIN
jgi:hypothetical protein